MSLLVFAQCVYTAEKPRFFLVNHLTHNLRKILKLDYCLIEFKFGKGGWKLIQRESEKLIWAGKSLSKGTNHFYSGTEHSQIRQWKSVDDPTRCPTVT